MEQIVDIRGLCDESAQTAIEHGFSGQSFPEFISLVHSELSEALEEYRDNRKLDEIWYTEAVQHEGASYRRACDESETAKPEGIPTELADVIIRICHYCGENKIDLAGALVQKLRYNKTRSHKHGNKRL
jgi:NTP pyrophosphatase (non-canonical NTP hydrolase)